MSPRPAPRPWTADEIAIALKRTRLAVYARLQSLDIKRRKAGRRLVEFGLKVKK
jgi:hypothetical protein